MTDNEAKEAVAVAPTKSLFGGVSRPVEVAAKDVDEKLVEASGPAELEPIHANVEDVEREFNSLKEASENPDQVVATSVSEDNVVTQDENDGSDDKNTPSEAQVDPEADTKADSEVPETAKPDETTETAEPTPVEDAPSVSEAVEEPVAEVAPEAVSEASTDIKAVPEVAPVEGSAETVVALQAQKAVIDGKLTVKQKEERAHVISQIAAVVKTYAIPVRELVEALGGVPSPRKGIPAPILYRDTNGNAWSGRGKTPKWLKDKNLNDFKV